MRYTREDNDRPQPTFPTNPKRQWWSKWHWVDVVPSWTWPGQERKPLEVTIYSSSPTTDYRFRAFDACTGKTTLGSRTRANAHATPVTFQGKSGKQFVVIAAGGGGFLRALSSVLSDTVVAYALR